MDQIARSPKDLSNALRNVRKARSLSQAQLASLAGVWPRTISMLETGAGDAKLETLFDLLAALDLELHVVPRRSLSSAQMEDIF